MSEQENVQKTPKVKPSAMTKVTFKVDKYIPGMENDPEFEGVSFARVISAEIKAAKDTKAVNTLRQGLMSDKCKAYGVKPLGAASAPSGGITRKVKDWVLALVTAAKELGQKIDAKTVIKLTKGKQGVELTEDQVKEILAG